MSDDKKLMDRIKKMRGRYKTELEDDDEGQMSFIDDLNDLIRTIFNDDPADVYTTLKPGELEKWKGKKVSRAFRRFFRNFGYLKAFYFLLLLSITGFLVSEAIGFYAIAGIVTAKTYVKAVLTEVCFIFLSGYRATGKLQTWAAGILRSSIFCLMLFVISSDVTMKGISDIAEIDKIQEKIEFVQEQILHKDKLIEFYREKDWGVNVRVQTDQKDKLVEELLKLKEKQIEGKNEDVSDQIVYQTWGRATFRILLLFISVLLTRRLFKF